MKKLLILSGKGGTGKTTVASAFISFLNTKSFADCDVDAPNLHLTVNTKGEPERKDFFGLPKAVLEAEKCIGCGSCISACRFKAVSHYGDHKVFIDPFSCEGCGVCAYICAAGAIKMNDHISGETILYKEEPYFSTAKLKMGSGASGKLVSEVKKNIKVVDGAKEIAIIDGSPGIGCPVIASITGVDIVLVVTEPTVSGISDLERILLTINHFKTEAAVCINKYDINIENTEKIIKFCKNKNIKFVGTISYDKGVIDAVNKGKSIMETDCNAKTEVEKIINNTIELLY